MNAEVYKAIITAWDSEQLLRLPSEEAYERQRRERPGKDGQRKPARDALIARLELAHMILKAVRGEQLAPDLVERRVGLAVRDYCRFRVTDERNNFRRHNIQY
jgi:hypothetical protein